jgi:hypothetical protein
MRNGGTLRQGSDNYPPVAFPLIGMTLLPPQSQCPLACRPIARRPKGRYCVVLARSIGLHASGPPIADELTGLPTRAAAARELFGVLAAFTTG